MMFSLQTSAALHTIDTLAENTLLAPAVSDYWSALQALELEVDYLKNL